MITFTHNVSEGSQLSYSSSIKTSVKGNWAWFFVVEGSNNYIQLPLTNNHNDTFKISLARKQ